MWQYCHNEVSIVIDKILSQTKLSDTDTNVQYMCRKELITIFAKNHNTQHQHDAKQFIIHI